MKNTLFLACAAFILSANFATAQSLHCGTSEKMQERLAQDSEFAQIRQDIEDFTERYLLEHNNANANREVVTIPVVVHVVYNTTSENISDAQVQSQIDVLNEDYRAQNPDISGVPFIWTPRVADCEIQFALAVRSPEGSTTNGITRTETTVSNWGGSDNVKFTSQGGHDAWPADDYLNIWVCNIGSGLLGYAYQPGINAALDGVVIGHRYFGRIGSLSNSYDEGRTATHEIGHYFNLDHLWGPGGSNSNCTADDNVSDTPRQTGPNYGCNHTYPEETCGTGINSDMFNNYMDYGNDECLFFFTEGQKARMLAVVNGFRSGLKDSDALTPVVGINEPSLSSSIIVYPNPANDFLNIRIDQAMNAAVDIQIVDMSGRLVYQETSVKLGYSNYQIMLNELPTGAYVLRLQTDEELVTKQINIIR